MRRPAAAGLAWAHAAARGGPPRAYCQRVKPHSAAIVTNRLPYST
jgi:hypothetical protein